ncbi:MAG TPA: type III pantothenate kinase [Polyangiaceae bacterium]|nr:type III pantothenate kinase [Polyangiaceae bacterium]
MLLAIDLGNTNITLGLFEGERLLNTFRVETVHARTADEYAIVLRQMFLFSEVDLKKITAAVMASVVPPLTDVLADATRQAFGCVPLIIGPGTKTGISVRYENPYEVGADRVVNAAAAFDKVKGGAIVVDFGTATTFDCISPKGEYLGGVIAPGIRVSLEALLGRAAKLRPVEIAAPPSVLGRNSAHSMQSGIIHGYASLVDGLVAKLKAELGFPCAVLATGGLAPLIAQHTQSIESVDPELTLVGLRLIYQRNKKSD